MRKIGKLLVICNLTKILLIFLLHRSTEVHSIFNLQNFALKRGRNVPSIIADYTNMLRPAGKLTETSKDTRNTLTKSEKILQNINTVTFMHKILAKILAKIT